MSDKRICIHCNKTLKKIGFDRADHPSSYSDWASRKYHKKCYYIVKAEKDKEFNRKLDLAMAEKKQKDYEEHQKLVQKWKDEWYTTRMNNLLKFVEKYNNYEDPDDQFLD